MSRHADETSWREKAKRFYLWVAVVPYAAIFLVRPSRAAKVAKELLGVVKLRVVVTDRYMGYDWIPIWLRQLCLAHLRRDARKMEDRVFSADVRNLWRPADSSVEARRIGPGRRRLAVGAMQAFGGLRWASGWGRVQAGGGGRPRVAV